MATTSVVRRRQVATWDDVERLGLLLPAASLGVAHEGSPAICVRTKQFVRLRLDERYGQMLQFWVPDPDLVKAYAAEDPGTYWGAPGYSRIVVMARLDRLDSQDLRAVVIQSWCARAPVMLRRQHPDFR
jgi:hypothetical protein